MIRALFAGLVLAAFALTFSVALAEKPKEEAKETVSEGTVKSVDAEKGDVVVTDKDSKDHKFHAKDAAVTIDGKEGKLADVKAGAAAKVTAKGHTASKVEVTSAKETK